MQIYGLRQLLLITMVMAGCGIIQGQSLRPAPWQPSLSPVSTYNLNEALLQQLLDGTVSRWESGAASHGIPLMLPLPDGDEGEFQIWRSPQMARDLADRFPDIQTYFGQNRKDPRRTVYILQTALQVKILYFNQAGMSDILEALSPQIPLYQFVPPFKGETVADLHRACTTQMDAADNRFDGSTAGQERRGETKLYRYRLALACTGEYGSYHGTDKEAVLAAMHELLLQVNAIFERELSIHFDLVADNDELIFLDPETDPYDDSDVESLLERNKMVCNYAIGHSNFDLGHVLTTRFGGQAHIGSVCNFSRKAKAFSGLEQPEGYYLGAIFAHELAHQIGAQHTQSNDCNRNLPTSFEPGSGSTLMAYAGICAPNVQELPDDYFHGNSLELMAVKAAQGFIFGCVPGDQTDNLPPAADAGPDLYVPIGTPFQLKGSGTDPDDDSLSYLWEQMDARSTLDTNNLYGSVFRSKPPSKSPVRLIGDQSDPWEQLPDHARSATFRLTVRDHHFGLGSTAYDEMTVHFIDTIGPFTILNPNLSTDRWEAGSQQLIEWDEAGTTQAPVSCDSIDILLSADGGLTYDMVLAAGIPNNGSATVDAPELVGTGFRIKVGCSNGSIFDVSDHAFEVFSNAVPADTLHTDTTPSDTLTTPIDTMTTVVEDTVANPVLDTTTVPIDTLVDTPLDTALNNPLDTLIEIPVDTILNNPLDTLTEIPVDTLLNNPLDTLTETPVDTVLNNPLDTLTETPVDTVLNNPLDTLTETPVDTLLNNPLDSLTETPVDTVLNNPLDSLTETPVDTVLNNPLDTLTETPIDIILQEPQDTTVDNTSPSGGTLPGSVLPCPSCPPTLAMAPNPTSGLIYLRMQLGKPALGHFYLLDAQGRILQVRRQPLIAGLQEVEWDLSPYPGGLYWVRFTANGRSWIKTVVLKR